MDEGRHGPIPRAIPKGKGGQTDRQTDRQTDNHDAFAKVYWAHSAYNCAGTRKGKRGLPMGLGIN